VPGADFTLNILIEICLLRRSSPGGPATTPTQRPAVPRAEHPGCLKSRHNFCEARGIGSCCCMAWARENWINSRLFAWIRG